MMMMIAVPSFSASEVLEIFQNSLSQNVGHRCLKIRDWW